MAQTDIDDLQQQLIQALARGDEDAVASLGRALARSAEQDFPVFHRALNMLGYHNRLALIVEMMELAWAQVQETPTYSKPAVDAYAGRATDHLIYRHLQERQEPGADREALAEQLETYFAVDAERLSAYLRLLSGEVGRPWTLQDFDPLKMEQLSGLMVEFLGYAHRAEDVPYSKSHLVREQIPRYLLDREAGNLFPKQDIAAILRREKPPFPIGQEQDVQRVLSPDRLTLQTFLERALQTLDNLPYAAAATLELMPVWVRFLQRRGLLAETSPDEVLPELQGLADELASYWQEHADPALHELSLRMGP